MMLKFVRGFNRKTNEMQWKAVFWNHGIKVTVVPDRSSKIQPDDNGAWEVELGKSLSRDLEQGFELMTCFVMRRAPEEPKAKPRLFKFTLGTNRTTGEPQWQSVYTDDRGTIVTVVPDRESPIVPSNGDTEWFCHSPRNLFESPDRKYRVLAVMVEREIVSERAKRRREEADKRHLERQDELVKERDKAKAAAAEAKTRLAAKFKTGSGKKKGGQQAKAS